MKSSRQGERLMDGRVSPDIISKQTNYLKKVVSFFNFFHVFFVEKMLFRKSFGGNSRRNDSQRHDTQHNGTQHSDTQQSVTQHIHTQHSASLSYKLALFCKLERFRVRINIFMINEMV